jgi:hypothetical protein
MVGDSILLRAPRRPFKVKVLCFFETSEICYPMKWRRGPGEPSPRVTLNWGSIKCGKLLPG